MKEIMDEVSLELGIEGWRECGDGPEEKETWEEIDILEIGNVWAQKWEIVLYGETLGWLNGLQMYKRDEVEGKYIGKNRG